jgi:hypothetical protein
VSYVPRHLKKRSQIFSSCGHKNELLAAVCIGLVPPSVQSGLKFDWGGPSLRPAPRALRLQLGNFALEPRDPNVANRARPVLTQLLSSPLIAAGPRQLLKHFLCPFRILGKKAEPRLHKCVRGETVHLLRHPFFQFCHHRGLHWLHIWKAKKLPCLRWRAVNFNSDLPLSAAHP